MGLWVQPRTWSGLAEGCKVGVFFFFSLCVLEGGRIRDRGLPFFQNCVTFE